MANPKLKRKIREFFRREFVQASDESVRVMDGYADNVHIAIVSHRFDGLDYRQQQELIDSLMYTKLSNDVWGPVSLTLCSAPDTYGRSNGRRTKRA